MTEERTDRNKFKKLFSNTGSRTLLAAWLQVKGSRFSFSSIADLLSLTEDALDAKLQTFAGMGLVHVTMAPGGERQVEFLPPPSAEVEKTIVELFEGRKADLEAAESKLHALIYKKLLTTRL